MRLQSEKGFTLIEMVVVMGVFVVIIMMVGTSFSTLLKYSSKYMKSQESNVGGNVGLELLRHDIASAGFGLPASFLDPNISYQEDEVGPGVALNDSPLAGTASVVPPALSGLVQMGKAGILGADGNTYTTLVPPNGAGTFSDYFALKATSLGTAVAAQKWTYATFNTPDASTPPKAWPSDNLQLGDWAVVLGRNTDGSYQLMNDSKSGTFSLSYTGGTLGKPFAPPTQFDTSYVYGVADSNTPQLRFPFNRADYLVATPPTGMLPSYCAPNTGILYRALVQHADGNLNFQPVLDCVADMHVVLGWNTTGTGGVDTWSKVDGSGVSSSSGVSSMRTSDNKNPNAATVYKQLKVVKVYILAQDGKLDKDYTSPSTFKLYNTAEEGQTPGATYTLQPGMQNYHWKVYQLLIRPKNLSSNQ